MIGSWMLIREESLEAARKRLARDIYAQRGAWDMDSVSRWGSHVTKHNADMCVSFTVHNSRRRGRQALT